MKKKTCGLRNLSEYPWRLTHTKVKVKLIRENVTRRHLVLLCEFPPRYCLKLNVSMTYTILVHLYRTDGLSNEESYYSIFVVYNNLDKDIVCKQIINARSCAHCVNNFVFKT